MQYVSAGLIHLSPVMPPLRRPPWRELMAICASTDRSAGSGGEGEEMPNVASVGGSRWAEGAGGGGASGGWLGSVQATPPAVATSSVAT